MSLTIDLSPEVEAKINSNAKRQGISPTDFVRRLVEDAPLSEVASQESAAGTEADAEGPTLWELHHEFLQAMWDAQPDGPVRHTSEIEASCDAPEGK